MVGRIAAGAPIEAITDPNDAVELGDDFASDDAYALRVRGTSMIEDLIADGDLVVVQPAETADNGDVVVALLNSEASEHGEATLKRYFRERDRVRLQPANRTMEPIYARPQDVRIGASAWIGTFADDIITSRPSIRMGTGGASSRF